MNRTIYVIEDDENIRCLIKIALESNSYRVNAFETAEEALEMLEKNIPDLMIFDIMLPGISGTDAVAKLKKDKRFEKIAIIMLTAKDSELDKIIGLDIGADDYVTKPFSVMELMARVRSLLRRSDYSYESTEEDLNAGILNIRPASRTVYVDGKEVALTYKEFEMLKFFVINKNRVISRDELLSKVWGYKYAGETRTVDIHMRSLRQKLGAGAHYLKTSRGSGYIFEVK